MGCASQVVQNCHIVDAILYVLRPVRLPTWRDRLPWGYYPHWNTAVHRYRVVHLPSQWDGTYGCGLRTIGSAV